MGFWTNIWSNALSGFAVTYTYVRTSEEIEAPWSEFDLDEARWTIPAERMKMDTHYPRVLILARNRLDK